MTSFDTLESSLEASRPVELYELEIGSDTFRFHDSEDTETITVSGDDYTAESISRTTIAVGGDRQNRTLNITMPSTNDFASQFVSVPPGRKTVVRVYRMQRDETPSLTRKLFFTGQAQSFRFTDDGTAATLLVKSVEFAIARNIPKFTYMGQCNHVLYDSGCGVDPNLFMHSGTVTAVTDNVVTVAGAGASGFDFVAGYCTNATSSDFRMVIAQSGDDLTLLLPFETSPLGGTLQVFAGCDHNIASDCALVFDNVAEYGGYAWVPSKSPFESGLT